MSWGSKNKVWNRRTSPLHTIHEPFPSKIAILFGCDIVFGTFDPKKPIAERGIDQIAMVRAFLIVMHIGSEESARDAHSSDRNIALLLERSNHFDQGAQ